jgi:fructose-bisphosphate aldolase class II
MARITLRQLLDHAAERGYGVPAFNINNMEQGLAIMEAAAAVDAPVIIQASRGARSYANDIMLSKMIDALEEMHPQIPLCLHQDHGNEEATCATAIKHGFTSVMMDGSLKADAKTAADYDYNVEITRRVVEMAHWIGASVEGELGVLGSLEHGGGEQEDGHGVEGQVSHDQLLTDPDQAVDFVRATKVDALAIAMGTSHGAYKFSRKPDGDILAMRVVEEIHRRLPNTHLVMHGSSSVPQPLQDAFNQFGGEMPQTWGVPVEEIIRGIKHGGRVPQGRHSEQKRVRSAQIPQTGDGCIARPLPGAVRAIRHRRPRLTDQGHSFGRDGETLSHRFARSTYRRHGRCSRMT